MLKKRIRIIAFAAAALAAASVVSVPAGAGVAAPKDCLKTVTVTDPGDDGSSGQLRTAIAQVCNGGTINVASSVPSPIYAGRFTIDKNVKLYGASQILVGSGFEVTSAGTLIMSGLDLDTGSSGWVAFDVDGVLALKDVTASHFSNAIVANPGSKVVLGKGTVITGNVSSWREGGAGIYNDGGAVTLTDDATVTDNLAWGCFTAGGTMPYTGWAAGVYSKGGSITLDKDAVISNNRGRYCDTTKGDGGAGTGGGIFMTNGAVTLSGHARVSGNIAGSGAGVAVWEGSVTLNDDAAVTGNQSTGGAGGVLLRRSTLTMNGASTIAGNTSVSNGGGVTNVSGVVNLNDTASITGNTVGGVYNLWSFTDPPRLLVNDQATITGNTPYDVHPANSAAPVAVDDRYALDTTGGSTTLTVPAAQGVLANDTDTDGSWLAASLVTGPTHGTLTGALAWNGSFAYTPEPGFSGVDTFTYQALDPSFESNLATVQIIVDVFCDGQLATIVGSGTITGTPGDDVIVGSAGPDTIDGLGGNDTICALAGDDTVTGGAGVEVIDAGDGIDTLVESGATFTLTDTSLTRIDVGVGTSTDTLAGIEQATLTGSGLNDTLNASGFSGAVTLDGLAGHDTLTGGSGNDTLTGGTGADTLNGGAGTDTIVETRDAAMTLTNTRLTIGAEGNDMLSFIEQAILTGGPNANTLTASSFSGQVRLYGVDGNDALTGGTGNDTLYGADGDDTLNGGPGDDTIYGGPGTDTWVPSTGTDTVYECEL